MSRPAFGLGLNNEIDIIPDDSISRVGVSNQMDDSQKSIVSSTAASVVNSLLTKKSDRLPKRSVLIFVKDDKYESNVDHLEELMGVSQALS
jgi:hypothetical protein